MGSDTRVIHPDWEDQRERLSAYLDGELSANERAALDAHLPGCFECQRELAALSQMRALLHALPTPTLPRSFTLPTAPAMPPRRAYPRWTRAAQALGGIAAMIGMGLLITSALPHFGSQHSFGEATNAAAPAQHSYVSTTAGASTAPSPTRPAKGNVALTPPPVTPTAGASTVYAPIIPSISVEPASQPFPVIPVSGLTLLVGGAAAVTAGSVARRRARCADLSDG